MEDINQLELTAYIIVASQELTNYNEKTIDNYIDLLEDEFEKTPVRAILDKAKITLDKEKIELNKRIHPRHSLNFRECINYSKLIFNNLLQHINKEFDENEIVAIANTIFRTNSIRNAEEKVIELGL